MFCILKFIIIIFSFLDFIFYVMLYLFSFLITGGVVFLIAKSGYVPGIELQDGYMSAVIFGVILAIVNLILGTVLRIITLPLRILTLGLFSFVISIIIVLVTDKLFDGITIIGYVPIIILALALGITSFILKLFR